VTHTLRQAAAGGVPGCDPDMAARHRGYLSGYAYVRAIRVSFLVPPKSGYDPGRRMMASDQLPTKRPAFTGPLGTLGTFRDLKKVAEPACKPGSVVDSHSSRRIVADTLKQPTRRHRGPRHCLPIWSCSRWGLPCRSVAGLAVRSYRTISPLPDLRRAIGGIFLLHFPSARAAQALPGTVPCGARTFLGTRLHRNEVG
jgi:hypothetical protein